MKKDEPRVPILVYPVTWQHCLFRECVQMSIALLVTGYPIFHPGKN